MNKAILVGVGVGIALIVIVGINAILITQEPETNELTLGDKVEVEIEKATEETLEPTGGTQYNFTVEDSFGLATP